MLPFYIIYTILSAITLILAIIYCIKRPTYEPKYIISKDEYLIEDHTKTLPNCTSNSFHRGNYLDNINSFIFKDKEL